ncbi:cytochrome P450 [Salinispora pacifica]|uniref:cytochrome P450 n=1 Tax=Salinispora pacifica TaxID=351187 RepID=UPI000481F1EA|nr:cytochrome P450 [Salinispora pacifica]
MTLLDTAGLGPLPSFLQQQGAGAVLPIVSPAGNTMWLVRDYTLARKVLTDPRFSRAAAVTPQAPKFNDAQPAADSMMSMDGAEHARLRRLVSGAFTTGRVAAIAPWVERWVDERLDRLERRGTGADLIGDLAAPLSVSVLCTLLGIPAADSERFRGWVEVLFDITASSPHEKGRRRLELLDYMGQTIEQKRRQPDDALLTVLIKAQERGEMSMAELLTLGLTLLMAGYETTVGQIGLAALVILSDEVVYDALKRQPERLPGTVEELLRLTPATPLSFSRVATRQVQLGEVTVRAGEGVVVSLLHGNRDPATFPDPQRLLPQGRDAGHLTFGHGVHRCLGAPLARLQIQTVLNRLIGHFPRLRLVDALEPVAWKHGLATRGLSRLSVEWR